MNAKLCHLAIWKLPWISRCGRPARSPTIYRTALRLPYARRYGYRPYYRVAAVSGAPHSHPNHRLVAQLRTKAAPLSPILAASPWVSQGRRPPFHRTRTVAWAARRARLRKGRREKRGPPFAAHSIAIFLGCACLAFGKVSVSTPSSRLALIFSWSTALAKGEGAGIMADVVFGVDGLHVLVL